MSFQSSKDYVIKQIRALVLQAVALKRHCENAQAHGFDRLTAEYIQAELQTIGVYLAQITIRVGEATKDMAVLSEAHHALNEPATASEGGPYRSVARPGMTLRQRLDEMAQQLAGYPA